MGFFKREAKRFLRVVMATRGVPDTDAGVEDGDCHSGAGDPHMVTGWSSYSLLADLPDKLGPAAAHESIHMRSRNVLHGTIQQILW